ncbi:MAG TPA: SAM-dependent methyltransferase [Bauldia sp.]|nr:SAM-dependent methyltransferase [Bauldia sp.]
MSALAAKLRALIRAGGPISVAQYMAICLGDPEHGYYRTTEPFGRGGDFITAPEVSQMFGELIGAWTVATWEAMGAPERFVLAELGPGRGTLIADLLRAARVRPAFLAAAEVHLVETSRRLRAVQRETLRDVATAWHDDDATLPDGPLIAVANEFFDALPVHQFVRTKSGWAERMVGLGGDGELVFGLGPVVADPHPHPSSSSGEARPKPEDDEKRTLRAALNVGAAVVETSPAAQAIMQALAARIAAQRGAALVIDYGYEGPAAGDTLQAVRKHRYDDLLAHPGEADLTAHVDFGALRRAAEAAGARAGPLLTQGEFLGRLGLIERTERLARGKDEATAAAIAEAARRLAGLEAMGDLFKAMAISQPGLALPIFGEHPRGEGE